MEPFGVLLKSLFATLHFVQQLPDYKIRRSRFTYFLMLRLALVTLSTLLTYSLPIYSLKEKEGQMSIAEFDKLSLAEQISHLQRQGNRLASREVGPFQIKLFQVDGFFVELWEDPTRGGSYAITCFNDCEYLGLYGDDLWRRAFKE
jgi:hypothetical protein